MPNILILYSLDFTFKTVKKKVLSISLPPRCLHSDRLLFAVFLERIKRHHLHIQKIHIYDNLGLWEWERKGSCGLCVRGSVLFPRRFKAVKLMSISGHKKSLEIIK